MIYDHMVKVNGRYYQVGEEVPEIEDMSENENSIPFYDEAKDDRRYTKSEISRMSTADLQKLAEEVGIENPFETSGNELKKVLAEHFGL